MKKNGKKSYALEHKTWSWLVPRWRLEAGSRKHASLKHVLERCWRHTLQAKPPRRGKTLTPYTPPASTENLHFTLNGDIRRAPGLPEACAQMVWEDADKFCSTLCVPFDETTTEQHLRHHFQDWRLRRTPKLLSLQLHCIWTWRFFFLFSVFHFVLFYFIYIYFFFHLLIFYFYSYLYSFYFLFSILSLSL
jgi:hypothetical protein